MQTPSEIESVLQIAARLAGDYLAAHADRSAPVSRPLPPEALAQHLRLELPRNGRPLAQLEEELETVLEHSVRTGHPRFFNQLFGGFDAAGILGEWMTALLNTSMYTYESAPVATLMELALIDELNAAVGFHDGEGVFAPGGSISNLMALLAARHRAFPEIKERGLAGVAPPCMFLSDQAHYSLRRAAVIAGIGMRGAIEVESDAAGRMRPAALSSAISRALSEGLRPFFVAATAGTTVPGAFDPIGPLADIAEAHGLWLHVDASYGGSVLLSRKHRHLMAGVERADSVTWNPHKMMGIPLACSATLLREKGGLLASNSMGADYLFHDEGASSFDLGDLTLQCGRRADALKLWLSWQAHGTVGFEARIDRLFELARVFRQLISERPGYVLVREPEGPNVCFRYLPPGLEVSDPEERLRMEDRATNLIRRELLQRGGFMINYATLDGAATFRIVLGNPKTDEEDLRALLDEIEELGAGVLAAEGV